MIEGPFRAPSSPPETPMPTKCRSFLREGRLAAAGVLVVGVSGVDNDVARFEERFELVDDGVDRLAGLDHDQDAARLLQRVHEFLQGLGPDEIAVAAVLFQQGIGLLDGPVVQGDGEAVAGQVAGEVCPHHRKAGDTDVC